MPLTFEQRQAIRQARSERDKHLFEVLERQFQRLDFELSMIVGTNKRVPSGNCVECSVSYRDGFTPDCKRCTQRQRNRDCRATRKINT